MVADDAGSATEWLGQIETPEQLGALIDQVGDADIVSVVASSGPEQVLDRVFEGMVARFVPSRAEGRNVEIQWSVKIGDATYPYRMTVGDGRCRVTAGPAPSPTVTLTLGLPDFLRLVAGRVNGVNAFMAGKLKLDGDMMVATSIESWFER